MPGDLPVLVVGEDAGFRRFVRLILQQAGYATLEARDAREAAAAMAGGTPCALVHDCGLGDDGAALRETLRARGFDPARVVWVTSGLSGARPPGPSVLTKPFDPLELVELLGGMLRKAAG